MQPRIQATQKVAEARLQELVRTRGTLSAAALAVGRCRPTWPAFGSTRVAQATLRPALASPMGAAVRPTAFRLMVRPAVLVHRWAQDRPADQEATAVPAADRAATLELATTVVPVKESTRAAVRIKARAQQLRPTVPVRAAGIWLAPSPVSRRALRQAVGAMRPLGFGAADPRAPAQGPWPSKPD